MANAGVADFLIKKGKRQTASIIQGLCHTRSSSDITDEVFDSVLNPFNPIDDWETIDWCRWLLAGGKAPEEYTITVRKFDNATTCGLVWTANFVAYRCRTCGISPCMSLCSDCFQRGDHEGHDFNMFRSQAGGACDCGDKSVMRESGFCQRHGPQNQMNKPQAPGDLLSVAEVFMPRLFLRLVQHLRDNSEPATLDRYQSVILMADGFLTLLHTHSEMGAAMRSVMTQALINPQLYYQLAVSFESSNGPSHNYKMESITKYIEARNSFEYSSDEMNFEEGGMFSPIFTCSFDSLKHSSFLDELVFWTIKFEFPQKLVCLLLNMMPDLHYKEAFTKIFVKHYDRISKMLAKSTDSDTLSNRVVHVSVQLFSNEDLAYEMTKDYDLLRIMIKSLHSMMGKIAHNSTLQYADKNDHEVVDCSHRIMKEHCYWPLVSDLNNVLTHEAVAFEFLSDNSLLKLWFKFLTLFQGMNVNQRELKDHVEFESNTYYAAFAAELEASATPMWALISHLKSPETLDKTKEILSICVNATCNWFDTIGFSITDDINPYQISFHIPLHRCFASFLGQAVRQQGASLDSLLPSEDVLKMMMMHPLQAQVAYHEILSNMWVRSGLQIKGQAMTYIQCHFCNSIVDADLFLLQICAMKLDPDWFLKTVMQRFHVWEWLTFHPNRNNSFLEQDKVLPMLEGALSFLTTLLSTHTNIGQTDEEVTRQEMVSLLCMGDRTHSQLLDLLPDKCGATSQNKDFESILKKVADYKAPNFEAGGTMLQGTFVPRAEIWEEEYDPIHVLLRAVHRREYQSSLDRYAQYLRQSNKFSSSRPPWPPYRIRGPVHKEFVDPRRILHCKTMHGIIFTILHRAVNDPDLPEQILSLCIYLLDMAVRFPYTGQSSEMKMNWATSSCDIPKQDTEYYRIFVGDLSPEIKTEHLREIFTPFGEILDCQVGDPQTPKSKGYGFVSFVKKADAENAIATMNGQQWLGSRAIRTNWATRKSQNKSSAKPLTFDEVYKQSSPTNCTVYCSGITHCLTDDLIQKTFNAFGTIQEIQVFKEKGCAFIRFATKEAATHAIVSTHNTEIDGQTLKCSWGKEARDSNNQQQDETKDREEVEDMKYKDWFDDSETLNNVSKVIKRILITEKVVMSMRMVEEMEVDEEVEEDMEMGLDVYEIQSPIVEEEVLDSVLQQLQLPPSGTQLALTSAASDSANNQLVPSSQPSNGELIALPQSPSTPALASSASQESATSSQSQESSSSNSFNMALIPTSEGLATMRPKCMKLKQVPGRHRLLLSDKGLPLAIQCCHSEGSTASGDQKYMSFSSKRTITINESILSLLLQLHSKLSEKPDSYQPKFQNDRLAHESRIGDGVLCIERVIDIVASSGEDKLNAIQKIRQHLWPKKEESSGSPSMENIDKEERRRRAKERQQKLMAEFASKQKAFMQKTLETDCIEGASGIEDDLVNEEKEYECVICGQMTASEENRPVGMVVLLQATSVIGHCHQNVDRKLPCTEEDRLELLKGKTLAAVEENRVEVLTRQFDNRHWPMAINIGWEGGVHVQSCGHYLHIDCHKSYVQSLKSQNQLSSRLQNLAVDRGEYSCPLCRQLANSVIPLNPNFGKNTALVHSHGKQFNQVAVELTELMTTPLSDRESKLLKKYMGVIMEDITNATFPQYRSLCSPNSSSLFLFVCSISRTNLEMELVQRGGSMQKPFKKKSCFVPLMHVLSMHSRLLLPTVPTQVWTRLTGLVQSDHYSVAVWDVEVPLLIRDCIALLLQIVLTLPLNIDKAYYTCVVQVLYNFLYIQGLIQVSYVMKSAQRTLWNEIGQRKLKLAEVEEGTESNSLQVLLNYVISNLQHSSLYLEDDEIFESNPIAESDNSVEDFMVTYCLHYLKIASLLQSHLYEEDIPSVKDGESEFAHLCQYLDLVPASTTQITSSSCIKWVVPDAKRLIDIWCQDFLNFVNKSAVAARALIIRHIQWFPPALLKLPHNYDDIFKYYHKKACSVCHSEPKDPSLCLVCGTMVCLRENCCRQSAHYEAVLHSVTCGAGTAMYLAVNSSTIIVIRGKRACLWGSVYLDSFGEEDRDLKRGKPLFLSEDRYNLLQQQWINHSFDHTNKRWVWHKDNL